MRLPGAVPIVIHEEMTRDEVADAVANASEALFFQAQIVAQDGSQLFEGDTITITNGNEVLTIEFDTGYTLVSPGGGGADIMDGETISISNLTVDAGLTVDTLPSANLGSGLTILVPGP